MSAVRTRKQKMMQTDSATDGDILANGSAKSNGTIGKVKKGAYKQENIFLFIPNLIGTLQPQMRFDSLKGV